MAEVSIADVVLRSVRHCEAGAKSSATVLWIDDDWWIVSVEPSCRNRLYRPVDKDDGATTGRTGKSSAPTTRYPQGS